MAKTDPIKSNDLAKERETSCETMQNIPVPRAAQGWAAYLAGSRQHPPRKFRLLIRTDPVTGLYNKAYFAAQAEKMLRANPDVSFALVRVDIDRFRMFNASFGKAAGDALLRTIADALRRHLSGREKTVYGHMESDTFCICLPYRKEALEQELTQAVGQARTLCEHYRLEFSAGIYVIRDSYMDLEQAYSYAAEAAKKCKNNVNRIYAYFDAAMLRRQQDEQEITNEMEIALSQKQFVVYLQPKYSLSTNRACGAEALVRWDHPLRGMISPGSFIPVFEQNGFIVQLDHFVWEQVCRLLQSWLKMGRTVHPVSVNISRVSLYDPRMAADIIRLTDTYGIPRDLLQLEITESAYMSNPELMKKVIGQLRGSGFTILMDDFGSGYSSLNTLKDIDVDILKIDMKFLPTGQDNVKSEKILTSIVRMSSWLGIPAVVEGVETKEQRDFLVSIGCGYVQGYFFARPMPVKKYEELMFEQEGLAPLAEYPMTSLAGMDKFWSADSNVDALFTCFAVPFAILECADGSYSVLRKNRAFINAFGLNVREGGHIAPEEEERLRGAMEKAAANSGEAECDCLFILSNGAFRWYHIHLQWMYRAAKSDLLAATLSDITPQRLLENEMNKLFAALQRESSRKNTLLIVDDTEVSRVILGEIFKDKYKILTAENGREGIALLRQKGEEIAMVLLDMEMPVMSGQEFLGVKSSMPDVADIPVIIISGDDNRIVQANILKTGVYDYITKPFTPEIVAKRVNNVLGYRRRFLDAVEEYDKNKQEQGVTLVDPQQGETDRYTVADILHMLGFLKHIFEVVRLVDPSATAVLTLDAEGNVARTPYSCFNVWNKETRCKNCSSLCAFHGNCTQTKYEFISEDIYYVVSYPVKIVRQRDNELPCVLEVVSKISDHLLPREVNGRSVREILEATQNKIYADALTGAYNRRYFDEMLFLSHGQAGMAARLGLVLMDMRHFKQINDQYGHTEGDRVLRGVAEALGREVRAQDSVIRYGGDEYVIVLTEMPEHELPETVMRLSRAVETVQYGRDKKAQGDFGCAYTDNFQRDPLFLQALFDKADKRMYKNKMANHLQGDAR